MPYLLRLCTTLCLLAATHLVWAQPSQHLFADGFEGTDEPAPTPSAAASSRFLAQASFGATAAEIERVRALGYAAWIDEQLAVPPSLHRPPLDPLAGSDPPQSRRQEVWFRHAVTAPDQLRQRVAFALSEIFVISDVSSALMVIDGTLVVAEYYDVLVDNAFGDYRQLLQEVTTSPAMGHYLSMFRSRRPDPTLNIRPDENYAREIMQLFSIGLVRLNQDGSPIPDEHGVPLPSYGQDQVRGYAHLFTGWNFASVSQAFEWDWPNPRWFEPMAPFEPYHDTATTLRILDDIVVQPRAPGSARADLDLALDSIASHPNIGPFIGYRLIQRLVTSNPSPAYVARIAAVWGNDGHGQRGNLGAVVRALLLDPEARRGHLDDPTVFGKLREPLIRTTHLWRAFDARDTAGAQRFRFGSPERVLGQAALRSPSVFNFFPPEFAPAGEIADAGLVAPEFAIETASLITLQSNDLEKRLGHDFRSPGQWFWSGYAFDDAPVLIDVSPLLPMLAQGPVELVDRLDLLLMAGQMSVGMREILQGYIQAAGPHAGLSEATRLQLIRETVYLVMTSPEYVVQR